MEKLEHLVFGVAQLQTNQFHLLQLMTINGIKLKLIHDDFMKVKSSSVTHINLDPSCSGSGLHTHHNRVSKEPSRLEKLTGMQKTLLQHAVTQFPNVQVVCYSTCSVFEEENEQVVTDILNRAPTFAVDSNAPAWIAPFRKGAFFQTTPEKHGCRGFFLAKLRKTATKKPVKLASTRR